MDIVAKLCNSDGEIFLHGLTDVSALPCDSEGRRQRVAIAQKGGLPPIIAALEAQDIKLNCKAANALGSLCTNPDVVVLLLSSQLGAGAISRLSSMVRSWSFWAQADSLFCLGWLLVPTLLETNATAATEIFQIAPAAVYALTSHCARKLTRADQTSADAGFENCDGVAERDQNLELYSVIFLLKLCGCCTPSQANEMAGEWSRNGLAESLLQLAVHSSGAVDSSILSPCLRLLSYCAVSEGGKDVLLSLRCVPALVRLRGDAERLEAATCTEGKQLSNPGDVSLSCLISGIIATVLDR